LGELTGTITSIDGWKGKRGCLEKKEKASKGAEGPDNVRVLTVTLENKGRKEGRTS